MAPSPNLTSDRDEGPPVTVPAETAEIDPAEAGRTPVLVGSGLAPGPHLQRPRMILVQAGSFTMGDGVALCGVDERDVTLTNAFYLGRYEVTNDEYIAALQWAYDNGHVTATSGSVTDNLDGSLAELVDLDDPGSEIAFSGGVFSLVDAGHGSTNGNHPVKEVSWHGSVAYCDWLSMMEGLPRAYDHSTWECNGGNPYGATGYRLPTDAEWEYAAQYDDERIYPWGGEAPDCSRANHDGGNCVGWTSPVGSYPGGPDILGELLYDMAGNVMEWCNDWHTCSLGTASATNPAGPSSGAHRVFRGGGWGGWVDYLRCARRAGNYPAFKSEYLGFRCARS